MSDVDALNYPYIHVRNIEWLKRTLLLFPHVVRIVPGGNSRLDKPEIKEFTTAKGRRGTLLRPARLYDKHVETAQRNLVKQIKQILSNEGPAFEARFGRTAARKIRRAGDSTYQLHSGKFLGELGELLIKHELAWRSDLPEADGPEYMELHPRLGEAIMSTLAIACAQNEGLEIVTEFPEVHGHVLGQTKNTTFKNFLKDSERPQSPITEEEAFSFIVYRRCDPTKLTIERLQALNEERDAVSALQDKLRDVVKSKNLKIIYNKDMREQYLNDIANDVIKQWSQDQANMTNYVKELFGKGKISQPARLIEKLTEKAFTPTAVGAAATPTLVGSLTTGALIGATAGFAIGLVAYSASTWEEVRQRERKSPFRYLSMLHKNGVAFTVGR